MANFEFNSKGVVAGTTKLEYLNSVYSEAEVVNLPWGKKIYTYIKGHDGLRAIIPIAITHAKKGDDVYGKLLKCRIAGDEGIQFLYDRYGFDDMKFFRTVEDAEKGLQMIVPKCQITKSLKLRYVMKDYGTWNKAIKGYFYNKPYHEPWETEIPLRWWLDVDGLHVDLEMQGTDREGNERKRYFSVEECLSDNKPKVVDFDDDFNDCGEDNEYTFTREVKIKAKNAKEAERKFNEMK